MAVATTNRSMESSLLRSIDSSFDYSAPNLGRHQKKTPQSASPYYGDVSDLSSEASGASMRRVDNTSSPRSRGDLRGNYHVNSNRKSAYGEIRGNQAPPMLNSPGSHQGMSSSGSNTTSDRQSNSSSEGSTFHRPLPIVTPSSQNRTPPRNYGQSHGYGSTQSPSRAYRGRGSGRQISRGQFAGNRAMISQRSAQDWADNQERKVRISNLPRGCWTMDVYQALRQFGTIVRIEIDFQRTSAWVTFQYVLLP
jgi:hypothetical protein